LRKAKENQVNLANMERRKAMHPGKVEVLLAVLDSGSITAAADTLGYTVSGVSRMMASLEEEVGFPLLVRRHEGVEATENCRLLLPSFRQLLHFNKACEEQVRSIQGLHTGTVRIGINYAAYYVRMEEEIRRFRQQYPGIRFYLKSGYATELAQEVQDRRLDLCLISRREGPFRWYPLQEDAMLAWVPAASGYAQHRSVPLDAFRTAPYIAIHPGHDVDNARVLAAAGIVPHQHLETEDSATAFAMVEAGLGIRHEQRPQQPLYQPFCQNTAAGSAVFCGSRGSRHG
jgi:DNA-binding transcriptional LysR family regulator